MKRILLSVASIAILGAVNAQENKFFESARFEQIVQESLNQPFDPGNARPGEDKEVCFQHKLHAALMQEPVYQAIVAQKELERANQKALPGGDQVMATTYYIPIVFHLVHNYGPEYISDEQIFDAFNILNRDYDLQNTDAANVAFNFNPSNPAATAIPSDVDIQFRLATKAPDGTCFNGITHTVSANPGTGNALVNTIINNNDVYNGSWAGDKYLNIFIAADIGAGGSTLAYTYTPQSGFTQMSNGVYVIHSYVGSIGTSSASYSRTLTHEVGHWLNLEHVWGGNNNPGDPSACATNNDGIDDTPDCIGTFTCNTNMNSCNGDNAYWGFDITDNVENYMDYAGCSKMFTPGQVSEMRLTLETNSAWNANRDNLITAANLNATGATGVMTLCRAEFSADKTTICSGDQIQFTDETYNAVNGWSWTFTGGTPSTSGDQNPLITYNTPGLYQVVLTATDGVSNDTETKTEYIRVLPASATVPFLEGFESYATLDGLDEWEVYNPNGNAGFDITTTAGHTGTKSAKLANFGQSAGNVDELASAPVDLSGITAATAMTMSFRYAYRQRAASNDEWLKVQVTNDCGETWVTRKTLHGTLLGDQVVSGSAWTPTDINDWTTVHMANVTSAYWVDNFRYKFRFESDGGNNFFLDNINIYAGGASNDLVVGLEESVELEGLTLFPNPTDNELNVRFSTKSSQFMNFTIQDVTGKMVQSLAVNANEGTNLVMMDTQNLASGMYFLNITSGGQTQAIQFVVK